LRRAVMNVGHDVVNNRPPSVVSPTVALISTHKPTGSPPSVITIAPRRGAMLHGVMIRSSKGSPDVHFCESSFLPNADAKAPDQPPLFLQVASSGRRRSKIQLTVSSRLQFRGTAVWPLQQRFLDCRGEHVPCTVRPAKLYAGQGILIAAAAIKNIAVLQDGFSQAICANPANRPPKRGPKPICQILWCCVT